MSKVSIYLLRALSLPKSSSISVSILSVLVSAQASEETNNIYHTTTSQTKTQIKFTPFFTKFLMFTGIHQHMS